LIFESGPFTYFGIQTLNQVIDSSISLSIDSPSSPLLAYKVNPANAVGTPSSTASNDLHKSLRKASTQQSIEVPNHILNNKRSMTMSGDIEVPSHVLNNKRSSTSGDIGTTTAATQNLQSRTGSVAPTYQAFVPDYTIKAVSDVLYLKIKRSTYSRALKASLMGKKASHSGELNERELENLLEKVEDESLDHDLNMMLRTPLAHSPISHQALEHEVTRVKVSTSGASTPTLAIRGDPTRMSLASKRSEFDEEFIVNKNPNPQPLQDPLSNMDHGGEVRAPAGAGNIGTLVEANGEAGGKDSNSDKIGQDRTGSDNDSNSIRANLLINTGASNAS